MASTPLSSPLTAITFLLFLTNLSSTTLSQNPGTSLSGPTIGECGPRLMPLVPCAPFVQGTVTAPAQPCCNNLKQIYSQQPGCLCLLLNNTVLSSLPINTTLALQLPSLCNLQVDDSTCSGESLPSTSPASQVSFGKTPNSTVAASPMVTVAPRPSMMGFGLHRNGGMRLMAVGHLLVVAVVMAAMVPDILC